MLLDRNPSARGAATKLLVIIASLSSIGFGGWHFFVPGLWGWYDYIDPAATELVAAIRATNFFFSLALVLFGAINLALVPRRQADRYALIVVLGATSVLWLARVAFQLIYPQGTLIAGVAGWMLAAFGLIFAAYAAAFLLVWRQRGG